MSVEPTPAGAATGDPWDAVVGQDEAVARLRVAVGRPVHAYLLVGPRGSGVRTAATVFAGELLAAAAPEPERAERDRALARREHHPDVVIVEPEGPAFLVEQADQVVREASRSPVEAARKIIVADRFHTAEPAVAPKLLKTIEEPPSTTIMVLLADEVPVEQVTIASRCVRVDFRPLATAVLEAQLCREGVDADRAAAAAAAAAGDLDRGRLLAADDRLLARRDAWRSVPARLDGTGAAVAVLVDELRGLMDEAQAPLVARHDRERADLDRIEAEWGTRGSGRRRLEQRHNRELRLLRGDELRFGLATLAGALRERLAAGADPTAVAEELARVAEIGPALRRTPNEALLLQSLLLDLSPH